MMTAGARPKPAVQCTYTLALAQNTWSGIACMICMSQHVVATLGAYMQHADCVFSCHIKWFITVNEAVVRRPCSSFHLLLLLSA